MNCCVKGTCGSLSRGVLLWVVVNGAVAVAAQERWRTKYAHLEQYVTRWSKFLLGHLPHSFFCCCSNYVRHVALCGRGAAADCLKNCASLGFPRPVSSAAMMMAIMFVWAKVLLRLIARCALRLALRAAR